MLEYKKWMASLLGMQRIVEGSEKIIMKEISQRILPHWKYAFYHVKIKIKIENE